LQTALLLSPNQLEARRLLASLLEDCSSSDALVQRRKLIELQPQFLEPKLAFVRTALRLGNFQEATRVLNSIRGPHRKTAEFMELQAELYLARERTDMALEVYRELIELEPDDQGARVKLTALELLSGPEHDQAAARAMLESLTTDNEFGLLALRTLARDALQRDDLSAALSWSKRASERPLAEPSDRMLHLHALFAAKSPALDSWLSDLEKMALENPEFALELGKWKLNALGPQQASAWLESLPKSLRENLTIGALLADCYSVLKRWSDLESLIDTSGWRELEPIRLAFLARAQAGQGNLRKSERTWQLALTAAEKNPEELTSLLAIARADKRDVRQTLWMIAERDPRNLSARRELYQAYWQERNADGMLRMMELVLKESPNDRAAKYNVAALLLVAGRQVERAARLASELYEADPQNLGNAALLGFGLHLQGDSRKAADLLDSRDDLEQLGNDAATYYALILAGCGRVEEARRRVSEIDRQMLLPELRASLDRVFGTPAMNAANYQPD
jgi:Flp pilus assembly protein TadD